jgi:PAS domain S-box-containing protein
MTVPPQAADGSLVQLIRTHDWAVTPLGPVTDWPPSLLTAVDICVTSRIPTALCWGQQEKRLIYNDAYAPILGSKHPASLGEPARLVWPEIWPEVGPLLEGVFRGESFFFEDRQMTVQRAGYPEEVYFTFSFSPITVPGGGIGGAFCSVTETTARVLAERRRVTLHRLGTIPVAGASTDEEACLAAMAVLAGNPADVPFAMIYLLGPDGEHPRPAGPGAFPADAPLTAQAADTLLRPTIEEVISTQAPRMVTGLPLPPRWPGPAGEAAPDAVLVLPLTVAGNGHPTGVLCCAVSPYRALDDDYRAFFDLVARQLGTLVADARSREAERIRSERLAELDLAKPFSARELLAQVRSALEPARLRLRESRTWQALVESLDEGFFVCDERGLLSDVNDAFGQITGYGPEGLPYRPPYPWQPDAVTEPELRRLFDTFVEQSLRAGSGRYTYPIRHRDGRVVWAATTVQAIPGQDDRGRVFVGTIRDVTAEHEAAGREAAVARLAAGLAGAADVAEVLNAGLAELHRTFGASRAVAAIWPRHGPVSVTGVPATAAWPALDEAARNGLEAARRHPVACAAVEGPACVGAWMEAGDADAAVWVDRGTRGPLGSADRALFGLLSAQLGLALARAMRYEQARDVALALQQSILGPLAVPAGFAVRYEPAMRPLEVGGDWHDVTPLGDGRIGVIVGDCVGRGLDAAAVMGQLRSACRALLLQAGGPAQVITDLDNFAHRIPGATCTTVFCAIIDPAAATIRYSSAGHLPAVLVHCDGAPPELLDRATAVPLAVLASEARSEATALLRPGSALLLYTDGLIERRGERLDVSIGKATELVQRHLGGTPDELADRVMAAMRPAGGFDDDVAVLTYRQPGPRTENHADVYG